MTFGDATKVSNGKGCVFVLGGDGFCGWPTALHMCVNGYDVLIIDSLVRREQDVELGVESLTPICSIEERVRSWNFKFSSAVQNTSSDSSYVGRLSFHQLDLSSDEACAVLSRLILERTPHSMIHFAEQRSAPYSMKSSRHKLFTVKNNLCVNTNVLNAIVETDPSIHLVHLGTMGVYGYGTFGALPCPEGYLDVYVKTPKIDETTKGVHNGVITSSEALAGEEEMQGPFTVLHPYNPGSVYHLTKTMDHSLFQFYAKNDNLRITDLHQGIVWGTQTEETKMDDSLKNRFDWDSDFGTVLNRFIVQAATDEKVTVYGEGGQRRAFIHIQDAVNCYRLAVESPPRITTPNKVCVKNQVTETHTVKELAELVTRVTNKERENISHCQNPRHEAPANQLVVDARNFHETLHMVPKFYLSDALAGDVLALATSFKTRIESDEKTKKIMPSSFWSRARRDACNQ